MLKRCLIENLDDFFKFTDNLSTKKRRLTNNFRHKFMIGKKHFQVVALNSLDNQGKKKTSQSQYLYQDLEKT